MTARPLKICIGIRLVFLMNSVVAQPFVDVLNVQYQTYRAVDYDASNDKLVTHQSQGNIFLPIELKNKNVAIVGGGYNRYQLDLESNSESKSLYALSLNLGGIKQWQTGKWSLLLMAIPKIGSDAISISDKRFQMGGVVMVNLKKSDYVKWKAGLYYNHEFFGNLFVPLVGIDWKANDKLNIYGVIPNSMNLEYCLTNDLYVGYTFRSIMGTYRLSEDNQQYYVRDGHRIWGHIQNKLFVNAYPVKNIVVFLEAGFTFARRIEMYEDGDANKKNPITINPIFLKTNDGIFFNVGTAYRIRLDN